MIKFLGFLFLTLTCADADPHDNASSALSAVVIDSDQQLQCTKDQKKCDAHGGVKIRKDQTELTSDDMSVRFTDDRTLKKVRAKGNVRFRNEQYKAQAAKAVYNPQQHLLKTQGDVTVLDDTSKRTLTAQAIDLHFKPTESISPKELDCAKARGGVTLRTAHELVESETAEYIKDKSHIRAKGHVTLVRKEGIVTAPEAETDLAQKNYVLDAEKFAKENQVFGVIFPNQSHKNAT